MQLVASRSISRPPRIPSSAASLAEITNDNINLMASFKRPLDVAIDVYSGNVERERFKIIYFTRVVHEPTQLANKKCAYMVST